MILDSYWTKEKTLTLDKHVITVTFNLIKTAECPRLIEVTHQILCQY